MKRDDLIFDIIEKEHQRQLKGIELIASENFVSDQVMEAMGSCLTNKYAEGYPGKRYYGGCEVVDQSEQIAIDRLKEIFGAEWANVQPHSGAQANAAVFLAVLNPGDKFMGLNLAHGGHLSHGSLVNTSGIIYTPCEYNLKQETGRVDYDQMEEVALREKPKMIIGGGSAYSREWDYKRTRAALVCEGSLVEVAQCLELGAYLKLGKGEEAGGGRERPSIIADAVEAVLAAVYLDGGIGSARKLIQKFILDREAEKSASRDYKTALQELVQRESGQVLGYQLIGAEGPDHAKIFSVEVDLNGIPIGQGRGRSKKEAEQNAARAAIEKLRAGE